MSVVPKVTAKAAEEVLPSVGLTYEGWLKAKEILLGNNPKAVSLKAAAKAAGVTPHELRLWARRAREGDPTLGDCLNVGAGNPGSHGRRKGIPRAGHGRPDLATRRQRHGEAGSSTRGK